MRSRSSSHSRAGRIRAVKKLLILSLVLLSGCATAPPADDSTAVNNLLNRWSAALKKGDARAVASMVTEDAEFWSAGAPPLIGREAVKKRFEEFFAQYVLVQEFEEVDRTTGRDHIIVRGIEHNFLTAKATNEKLETAQRAMSIIRRDRDGRWRFARGMTNFGPGQGVLR
jgi:uncharacterized protein (TIGR02246 family)